MACISVIGLAQDGSRRMQPRVLMGDASHCRSLLIRDGRLIDEDVCLRDSYGRPQYAGQNAQIAWDGHVAVITRSDETASAEWMRVNSVLPRLSVKHYDLYWDGKKVDLGRVDVYNLYEAIPWEGGVMVYGRTLPRRHFWESWPFHGHFIEARDLEPFCAIYFDLKTMKGEDLWLNGKVYLGLFVFPIPDRPTL